MSKRPSILVVTHEKSPRRAAVMAHLAELGVQHEITPAIFPEGESPWSPCYDHEERLRRLGYPMTRGEVGCFLAHRKAWQTIVERGLPAALVMEDDAWLGQGAREALGEIAHALGERAMFARLVTEPRPPFRPWVDLGGYGCLGYPVRPGNLTVAYVVTRTGAASLLRASERFWCPVDDFMNLEVAHGVVGMHLEPPLAEHRDGGTSLIGRRSKPPMGLGPKVLRELRRAWHKSTQGLARQGTLWRLGIRFRKPRAPVG